MIVTRIQLHCQVDSCANHYPADGALDGAIFTPADLRAQAYNRAGWRRGKTGFGLVDYCPGCYAKRAMQGKRKGGR